MADYNLSIGFEVDQRELNRAVKSAEKSLNSAVGKLSIRVNELSQNQLRNVRSSLTKNLTNIRFSPSITKSSLTQMKKDVRSSLEGIKFKIRPDVDVSLVGPLTSTQSNQRFTPPYQGPV